MCPNRAILAVIFLASFWVAPAIAETENGLVGVWEMIALRNDKGLERPPPFPLNHLIFSAEGYFSQTALPVKRPKINKSMEKLTREELLSRFKNLSARFGTYEVSGSQLMRWTYSHSNPNRENYVTTCEFRIEGDVMTLTHSGTKSEAKWRRLNPTSP